MKNIDFYILNDESPIAQMNFACRLIEKAYQQNNRVYVHTSHHSDATKLDQLLWTYRDDSFIPHHIYDKQKVPTPPIQIGYNEPPEDHRDILINLSDDVPNFYQTFLRIIEIVPNNQEKQAKARDRYRYYRDLNNEINTHKV